MARVHLNTQGNRVLTAQGCLLKVILPARLKAFPLDVRLQVSFLPAQIVLRRLGQTCRTPGARPCTARNTGMGMLSAMVWSPRPVWRPRHPRRMGGFHWSFPSMLRAPWADPPVPAGLVPQHGPERPFFGAECPRKSQGPGLSGPAPNRVPVRLGAYPCTGAAAGIGRLWPTLRVRKGGGRGLRRASPCS